MKIKTNLSDSQKQLIYNYLRSGKSLTPLQALVKFGCFRLGARIYDLKNDGCKITMELFKDEETGKRYAKYRMHNQNITRL